MIMAATSISARIKRDGNINRIKELSNENHSADDIKNCFADEKIKLIVCNGDLPLLANLDELERKALSKKAVKARLLQRQINGDPTPTLT
jgi:hypothetical protein